MGERVENEHGGPEKATIEIEQGGPEETVEIEPEEETIDNEHIRREEP